MICTDCPRNCGVDRSKTLGFCREGEKIRVAKIIENFAWEEPCISGKKGALAIFFSGCNLHCKFCQNYQISYFGKGTQYTPQQFADLLKSYDFSKFESLDLITPDHFSTALVQALDIFKPPVPVVWNCSGYQKSETLVKVAQKADVFLMDVKFFDPALSFEMCGAKDYFEYASSAIKTVSTLKKNIFKRGILQQGVVIRHLILPGYVEDSKRILKFVKESVKDPIVSIMGQFTPTPYSPIKRGLKPLELKVVLNEAQKLGLNKGYTQDLGSCNEDFIPKF